MQALQTMCASVSWSSIEVLMSLLAQEAMAVIITGGDLVTPQLENLPSE